MRDWRGNPISYYWQPSQYGMYKHIGDPLLIDEAKLILKKEMEVIMPLDFYEYFSIEYIVKKFCQHPSVAIRIEARLHSGIKPFNYMVGLAVENDMRNEFKLPTFVWFENNKWLNKMVKVLTLIKAQ